MASLFKASLIFIFFSLLFLHIRTVTSTEFEVGGDNGWHVPNAKEGAQMYNKWASNHRFKIGDTLQFKYKKDSVMAVTEVEYKKCRSSHPLFYSNNGNTVYKLGKPGLFYFISGVSGHCERGLKMIIKVLETPSPFPYQNQTTTPPPSNDAAIERPAAIASLTIMLLIMSFSGLLLY
ncbi:Phytocyanin domain-containing protein [Citrus sinensis]|uniref:Phytocyanin domain-containing protein n=1 Tax=Citrus sinensis TaxID=2711 RepID=A0ACB8LYK6_CITSI|nr:Phytocyanin domain-containing protein [Citrus sinensis]